MVVENVVWPKEKPDKTKYPDGIRDKSVGGWMLEDQSSSWLEASRSGTMRWDRECRQVGLSIVFTG